MFSECKKLVNVYSSSFNAQNKTNMKEMFKDCYNLVNVDLSNFILQMMQIWKVCFLIAKI